MSEYVDQYVQQIADAVYEEYQNIGQEMLSDMLVLISTPWPPASKGDSPPSLRTGLYAADMYYKVDRVDRFVSELTLENDLPLSVWLEQGTDKMAARPHFSVIYAQWADQAENRIQAAAQEAADHPDV